MKREGPHSDFILALQPIAGCFPVIILILKCKLVLNYTPFLLPVPWLVCQTGTASIKMRVLFIVSAHKCLLTQWMHASVGQGKAIWNLLVTLLNLSNAWHMLVPGFAVNNKPPSFSWAHMMLISICAVPHLKPLMWAWPLGSKYSFNHHVNCKPLW